MWGCHPTIHLRNGAIYGSSVSDRVPVIPVQFQPHNFTAVVTEYLGLFTDNSTKLHTLAVVRRVSALWENCKTLPISRRGENAPYNCQSMQFCETDRVTAQAVLRTLMIYHFFAELKTHRTTAKVCSFVELTVNRVRYAVTTVVKLCG